MGRSSSSLEKFGNIPVSVSFDNIEARLDFVVLKDVPFDLFNARATLKQLDEALEFRSEKICFVCHNLQVVVSMLAEYFNHRKIKRLRIAKTSLPIPAKTKQCRM